MELIAWSKHGEFRVPIKRKLTFIGDKSGEGKTAFVRALQYSIISEYPDLIRAFPKVLVIGEAMNENMAISVLKFWNHYSICVIDCGRIHPSVNICRIINREVKIPVVILSSREATNMLPVHYDSVYRFIRSNGNWEAQPAIVPKLGLEFGIPTIIEDSEMGRRFYGSMLGSSQLVKTSSGFGGLAKTINLLSDRKQNAQIIADGATFGALWSSILFPDRLVCFLPESFEEEMLNTTMFRILDIDKQKSLEQTVDKETGGLRRSQNSETTMILCDEDESVTTITKSAAMRTLARALKIGLEDVANNMIHIRKHIWFQDGRLLAVKFKGKWHVVG